MTLLERVTGVIHDRQLTISSAGSRRATQWPAQTLYWSELVERLRVPLRGTETLAEYLALPRSKQDDLKDVGGFVGGTLAGNRRKAANVTGRDILTLDLDNIQPGGTLDVLRRLDGLGCAYVVYSTRKHDESKPRLRVLVPLIRTATADEYEPLARKLGSIIGIELCDPTTFEASRLMYWPSCCLDSQYVYQFGDKPFLDTDGLLATYANWRNVTEWPEVPGASQAHVRLAAKQGDPTAKSGVVGAFCRIYDIYKAMATFLPVDYMPTDDGTGRYTFTGGSTTGGAVVYDDGAFLYSHHATDPAGGRLVNAFDLVRLHRFGELDDDAKADTPVNKLPSYVAMCEATVKDTYVAALLNQERYEKATQDFATPADAAGETANWISKLAVSSTSGAPAKTADNILIILENDPLLKNKIALDEFANRVVLLDAVPWDGRTARRPWKDKDDSGLRWYLERTYQIASPGKALDAVALCSDKHAFDDVRDYLTGLMWDGVNRLDTLFVDYLGAGDTLYTRAITRKAFTAAVARAMTPGCKFDNMTILTGAQGLGKSSLLKKMGRGWFSDSIKTFEGKEASELVQGVWIVEIGELEAFNRSETGRIKQFLSQQEDIFRAAFGHHVGWHPRRCVFFGTSNNGEYLRDKTGNRRFWPIDVGVQALTKNVFRDLDDEVDLLWAEAFVRWQSGEPLYLSGDLERAAQDEQEAHREADPREGIIREFVQREVPGDWEKRSLSERLMYWSGEFGRGDGETAERDRICAVEVWCECLKSDVKFMKRTDTVAINAVLDGISGWAKYKGVYRFGCYGSIKGGYLRQ